MIKENYCFPRFQRGSVVFQGGGGVELFSGVGVKMLISFSRSISLTLVQTLSYLWIRVCTIFIEFKVIFLALSN